jgi:hypothetical protein
MTLDGKPWQEAQVVLDNLDRALRAQSTRELLIAPIPTSLHDKLTILHAREAGWVDAFREWFAVNRAADSSIDLIPRPPWVENMTAAQDVRTDVYRGLEQFVYSERD